MTFFVAFISSILSGIAGGGGGFIIAPYWLISGMTPAQGSTTGAFMAIGMSTTSVVAFRKTDYLPKDKKLLSILSVVTFFASIAGAVIVPRIDVQSFKYMLAIITLSALPLLFIKPKMQHHLTKNRELGLGLAVGLLVIGSVITSSAFSILFALTLMTFFNMSALQMTALRRAIGVVQSVVLFVTFAIQGYFIWQHAIAGLIGGSIGSYIGTKYAIKKGELFARYALVALSFIGVVMLFV